MKIRVVLRWFLFAPLLVLLLPILMQPSHGQEGRKSPSEGSPDRGREKTTLGEAGSKARETGPADAMPVYKPPLRGAPGGRMGGGTRGLIDGQLYVSVLAPDHVGLSVHRQPDLFWFISRKTDLPIECTIIERETMKPVLKERLETPGKAGIQRIRLADLGLTLKPDVRYEWFVVAITDPDRRSKDIMAGAALECVDPPPSLVEGLKKEGKIKAVNVYAENGFWYDTMAAISDLIDASPNDGLLRKKRASLLDQIGLSLVAEFEREWGR